MCIHKYGKVERGDYQYCEKCGKAIRAPKHIHHWVEKEKVNVKMWGDAVTGQIIVKECSICGDVSQFHVGQTQW